MNAFLWNRDLALTVQATREAEAEMTEKGRAAGTVAFPELRAGEVAVCMATVLARVARPGNPLSGYRTAEIAWSHAQGQRAWYLIMQDRGALRLLGDWPALDRHLRAWQAEPETTPLGVILTMEGGDPILGPEWVARWWEDGVRAVSLSHYGVSSYAHGTATPGPLSDRAPAVLREMEQVGMVLDLTHLADEAFWQAVELYSGPVIASHQNCRALVPGDRQFTDDQIREVIRRDGVLGAALDAWMLQPGWIRGETTNENLTLEAVADQIDHVCQLAGNAAHAAIGSDLDGGYGIEQVPRDLDTIADLPKVIPLLRARGYSEGDIAAIYHGNWTRFWRRVWGGGGGGVVER
jgi:membrane dipeptidase